MAAVASPMKPFYSENIRAQRWWSNEMIFSMVAAAIFNIQLFFDQPLIVRLQDAEKCLHSFGESG